MAQFQIDGPANAKATFLFAHGSGVGMCSDFMIKMATGLTDHGIRVARLEFAYMAARRSGGSKRPPPRVAFLEAEFTAAIEELSSAGSLFIGGKSMGGRIASMIGEAMYTQETIAGIICLGYPFHPTGKPENLRVEHLKPLTAPLLICQGTRDPFGTLTEVSTYDLPAHISIEWLEDGDHGFKPRKASGVTLQHNMTQAIDAVARFISAHS